MTTKTTGQRTPGPYHAGDFGLILSETDKIIGQAEGINKDNNAAFIVRACNSHNALAGALQDFIDAATESSKNESYKANAYGFMMAVLPKARAALTAATKK